MQLRISILVTLAVITTCLIIVPKTTLSQSVIAEKAILDYKIDTGIRLHPGLVRKLTHGQIEKDIVQWVMDNFDTVGGANVNLSNHSLVANGNYHHSWNKYQLFVSDISVLNFTDTFNNALITNNPSLQTSPLFINQNPTIGSYGLKINNGSTRSSVEMLATSSENSFVVIVNGLNGITIDSSTNKVALGRYTGGKYGISINRHNGQVMVDSAYYLPTTAGAGIGYVLQTTGTYTTAWNIISNIGLITTYNGSATAANGLHVIRSHGSFKNRSVNTTITSYTPPVDGEYLISGYFNISSITGVVDFEVEYTDQNSNPQTYKFVSATSTGVQNSNSIEIQAAGGSAITIKAVIVSGSVTMDLSGTITQLDN